MLKDYTDRPRRYFAFQFRLFRFLGIGWWHNPDENDTRNFPGWYIYYSIVTQLVCVIGFVSLESLDPFIGKKDMERFMFSISFVIVHDLTLIKLYIFFFKNLQLQSIVRTLELDLYDYFQNLIKNRATIRTSKILTASFIIFGWTTIIGTDIYGVIQDLHWKNEVAMLNSSIIKPKRNLPQPIYIPWNYQKEAIFILTFILETIGLLWTGHIVLTTDTFIGSVILHMSNQFITLQEAITTLYDRTMKELQGNLVETGELNEDSIINTDSDKIEDQVRSHYSNTHIESTMEHNLNKCIKQHQILIRCAENFRDTYSFGFLTQLLSSMTAICVVMVQVSIDASSLKSMKLMTSLVFFMAMITQLAIQCFTGSEMNFQSSAVADAVMQSKWELMGVRCRRSLLITMIRAQRPLMLTAGGFANMDNACFVAVMRTAYSYYAFLGKIQ